MEGFGEAACLDAGGQLETWDMLVQSPCGSVDINLKVIHKGNLFVLT